MMITEQARAQRELGWLDTCQKAFHPTDAVQAHAALDYVAEMLLNAGDARAAFPDIYAVITRRVAEEAARPDGPFLEPAWISSLAGRFRNRLGASITRLPERGICALSWARSPVRRLRYGAVSTSVW